MKTLLFGLLFLFVAVTPSVFAASETFQLTTDATGSIYALENVSFGKVTVQSFVANYNFANVKVIVDGTTAMSKPLTAGVKETINASARKKFEVSGTGGPANTAVTITIEYTLSPFRVDQEGRTAETFDVTTDGNGNFSAVEAVSFGKVTVQTFIANYSFGNVQVKVDGVVGFNKATVANVKETVNAAARKNFELIATGGPANTTVSVTIEYTLSPFRGE